MLELFIAFGAGLISFLSPCVLPLIPGYVSFITGSTLNEILEKKKINLLPLIVFSLGFSFVFIIFGATASFLGQILLQNSQILRIIAGVIIIIFSLQLIGVLNIKFLNVEKKFIQKNQIIFSFIYCGNGIWLWMDTLYWAYFRVNSCLSLYRRNYLQSNFTFKFLLTWVSDTFYFIRLFNAKVFIIFKKLQKKY